MTDELHDDEPDLTPAKWSWVWVAGCAVNALGNAARVVTASADEVALRLARHDAWREGQRQFADSVRRDLEMVTGPSPAYPGGNR